VRDISIHQYSGIIVVIFAGF